MQWFYAFSIAPQIPTSPPPARPANATKNPFTQLRSTHGQKRPLDADEGENFRWGNVRQNNKRSRTEGEPGKPPEGYKCKICESPDVSTDRPIDKELASLTQFPSILSTTVQTGRSRMRAISARYAKRYVYLKESGIFC